MIGSRKWLRHDETNRVHPVAKTPHHTLECFHPKRVLFKHGINLRSVPPASKKRLPATHPDFLDGFQAIRKRRKGKSPAHFDASRG